MPEDVDALHARLRDAGLHEHVDALVGLSAPAVRMRTVGGPGSAEHGIRVAPAPVAGLQRAALAIGSSRVEHFLAVLDDGSTAAWGENGRGQLGDGSRSDSDAPVGVRDLDAVAAVACGGAHSVALRRDGSVFGWGDNEYRQVCDAKRKFFTKPVPVSGLDRGVRAVAAGERNSFAVLDDGSVLGWGSVNLGPGGGADGGLVPIRGLEGMVVSLACGWWHTLALVQDGSLFAWGGNRGALGDGTTEDRFEPVLVRGLDGPVAAIAAGSLHSLALMVDGTVMAWGSNGGGAIGHGKPVTKELEPVRVPLPGKAVAIAAGGMSNHALLRDGSVVSWGDNSAGQLADGTLEYRFTPVPIRGLRSDVQAITLGAALLNDGSICRWGGTLAPSDDNDDVSPTAASKLGGRPDLPQGSA